MAKRIVVDPVTRIEGHLRIEAEVENGYITDAFSSGTMVRGIELIARNRDIRDVWAYVSRVCGVCTSIHGLAGVRSIENALGVTIPPNAQQVRNLMQGALYIQDHIFHFYQLQAFDWVDVISALKGDPKEAADIAGKTSSWGQNSEADFAAMKKKLQKFVDSGQLGFLTNGYWGHPAYKLPPSVNLILVTHYFQCLLEMKDIVKVQALFGGKNPHPNYLMGGMGCAINKDDPSALNLERLSLIAGLIQDAQQFMSEVYLADVMLIAGYYPEWTKLGGGVTNYLAYGDFPMGNYGDLDSYKMPRGIILNRDLSKVYPVDATNEQDIQEFVSHAWYDYSTGKNTGLHPSKGETKLNYTGPKPPYDYLDVEKSYSWIKTPRYKGLPMECGPLSRMLIGYASGKQDFIPIVDNALKQLNLPTEALFSTVGRTLARALEGKLVADWMSDFYMSLLGNIRNGDERMFNNEKWESSSWPKTGSGYSLTEAPRGALAHYAEFENGLITNYQMMMPTTWNGSPRDEKGQRSPFEESLIGTPVHDIEIPLEIIRTIHSFDPCLACAVHLYDEKGEFIHHITTK